MDVDIIHHTHTHTFFNFTIVLEDENDNAPHFDHGDLYTLTCAENNHFGQRLHKFTATDPDSEENGSVTYSLEDPTANDYVSLDPATGVLTANAVYDREMQSHYEFIVIATDMATTNPRTTRVKCILTITDTNDNRPLITHEPVSNSIPVVFDSNGRQLEITVDENAEKGARLLRFKCTDSDLGPNGATRIDPLESNTFGLARVSDAAYVLSLRDSLDRELKSNYDLVVTCRDNGQPKLNTTVRVRVTVNDVNDHCPRVVEDRADGSITSKFFSLLFLNNNSTNDDTLVVYERFYMDADGPGANSALQFELATHPDLFTVSVAGLDSKLYRVRLVLNRPGAVKLGKYVLKLKIRDSAAGVPCSRTDHLTLYLADAETRSERELLEKMRVYQAMFVSDRLDKDADSASTQPSVNTKPSSVSRLFFNFPWHGGDKTTAASDSTTKIKSSTFLATFIFIIGILVVAICLLFAVLLFLCRSLSRKFRKEKCFVAANNNGEEVASSNGDESSSSSSSSSSADGIKVRNYSEVELNESEQPTHSSRLNSSNSSDTNSDSGMGLLLPSSSAGGSSGGGGRYEEQARSAEIKSLLVDEKSRNGNRLSLSVNSGHAESGGGGCGSGSAAGDSALSSLLYTREFSMTSSQDDTTVVSGNRCFAATTAMVNRYPTMGATHTGSSSIKVHFFISLLFNTK
jgi:hypothetical protein